MWLQKIQMIYQIYKDHKTFIKAGAVGGGGTVFITLLMAGAYSDRGDAAIRMENSTWKKEHAKYGDEVLSARKQAESELKHGVVTLNENLFRLQQTIITNQKHKLEKIEFKKENEQKTK